MEKELYIVFKGEKYSFTPLHDVLIEKWRYTQFIVHITILSKLFIKYFIFGCIQ